MKSAVPLFIFTLTFPPMCEVGMCQSLCVNAQREDRVIQSLRQEASLGLNQSPMRAILAPDLTDDGIDLKTHKSTPLSVPLDKIPVFCFYRLTLPEYVIGGGMIGSGPVELDYSHEWIVAVNPKDESTFHLQGSEDPVRGFNNLIKELELQVLDPDVALRVFYFFLKVTTREQLRSRVLADDIMLESLALEDFRLRFPSGKARRVFEEWWKGVSTLTRQAILPPKAIHAQNGFEVQYFFYDEGRISKESLLIRNDGTVAKGNSKAISH